MSGNLNILKNAEAESVVQKFMRIGFVDTKGKTQQQVKAELEQRFGRLAKNGVRVYFYDEKDVDRSLDKDSIAKLAANGFAVTKDGTVWINKSHVDSGKVIDFNKTTQHEIGHIVFGEDSEYEAQYVEAAYRVFLTQVSQNGYIRNGEGITDYENTMLTLQEIARLNGYTDEEMQYFIDGALRTMFGDRFTNNAQNLARWAGRKLGGKRGEAIVNDIIEADRKFYNKEGRAIGGKLHNSIKKRTGIDTVRAGNRASDKIDEVKSRVREKQRRSAERNKPQRKAGKEEKEYPEYVADIKGKREELSGYQIIILGGNDKDGYLVYENGNTSKESLSELRDMIDEGKIFRHNGFILDGYGLTPQEAEMNYENRKGNILSGGGQMLISGYRVGQGIAGMSLAAGCVGLSSGGCTPLAAGIGAAGVSEVVFGGSEFIEGTGIVMGSIVNSREEGYNAAREYQRLKEGRNSDKGYSPIAGFNPLKGGLEYINAPDWLYPVANTVSYVASLNYAPVRAALTPLVVKGSSNDVITVTNLDDKGSKILIQAPNVTAVAHKNPDGYISSYGRVNGHGAYYSRTPIVSATRVLTQIGNTAGYDLVSSMNSTRNYPVTVYSSQVTELSTVNYINTLSNVQGIGYNHSADLIGTIQKAPKTNFTDKGSISSTKVGNYGISYSPVTKAEKDIADSIMKNGDLTGGKTEELTRLMAQRMNAAELSGGRYYSDQRRGFDIVLGSPKGSTLIIESKQPRVDGSIQLKAGARNHIQLTDKWIDAVNSNIYRHNKGSYPEASEAIMNSIDNENLYKAVSVFDRNTGKLIIIPVE